MKKRVLYVFMCALLWGVWGMSSVTDAQEGNVIVPNVEGVSQDIAAQILRTAGLHPQVYHKRGRSPIIVQQEPKPGLLVPLGSKIMISTEVVQTTPAKVMISGKTGQSFPGMADTQGKLFIQPHFPASPASAKSTSTSQAASYLPWYPQKFRSQKQPTSRVFREESPAQQPSKNLLQAVPVSEKQGLSVLVTPGGWQEGWIVHDGKTESKPGSTPETGMTIKNIPGNTATSVSVPHVIRLQQRDAITALNRAGLSIGIIGRVQDAVLKAGLVIQQSPASGSVVSAGTRVNLWVVE